MVTTKTDKRAKLPGMASTKVFSNMISHYITEAGTRQLHSTLQLGNIHTYTVTAKRLTNSFFPPHQTQLKKDGLQLCAKCLSNMNKEYDDDSPSRGYWVQVFLIVNCNNSINLNMQFG